MIEAPRIMQMAAQPIASLRLCVAWPEMRTVMGPALAEVRAAVATQGVATAGPWFTHHFRKPTHTLDFEICLPVATSVAPVGRVTAGELRAAQVARTVFHGNYDGLGKAWGEFAQWIADNKLTAAADFFECYVIGPEATSDPAGWRTEFSWPLIAAGGG